MNGPIHSGDDVALFIDWENFKISLAVGHRNPNVSALKEEVSNHGRVVVAKAYADWVTRAPELRGASQFINDPPALYAAGIEPVYVPTRLALGSNTTRTTRVKNSVDVKMTADCIEIAHSYPNIGTYVLVSGDSDFIHVVNALRTMGKHVIVIGGGDTGADCIGTSLRHGCRSLVNFELLDQPPAKRAPDNPWPQWPHVYRLDYSHLEAKAKFGDDPRAYTVLTKEFVGNGDGQLQSVKTIEIDWSQPTESGPPWTEVAGSEKEWPADLVLLATGFIGPEMVVGEMLGLEMQNPRGNWQTFIGEHGEFTTNLEGVFVAGDCRRGQSLVVWAINEGRGAARAIDEYLTGSSLLPAPGVTQGSALAGA